MLHYRSYTLKVADRQFTITPDMVEVKRFIKTVHGNLVMTIIVFFWSEYFHMFVISLQYLPTLSNGEDLFLILSVC